MGSPNFQHYMDGVPGRLVADPLNINGEGAAFPYGGTELGAMRDAQARATSGRFLVDAEEWGVEIEDVLDLGEAWSFSAFLRGRDDDAVDMLFAGATTGSSSGKKGWIYPPDTGGPGTFRGDRAIKLLFVPDDVLNHEAVLFYRALPMLEETAELNFAIPKEFGVGVVFLATRDATDRVVACQLIEDLTL